MNSEKNPINYLEYIGKTEEELYTDKDEEETLDLIKKLEKTNSNVANLVILGMIFKPKLEEILNIKPGSLDKIAMAYFYFSQKKEQELKDQGLKGKKLFKKLEKECAACKDWLIKYFQSS